MGRLARDTHTRIKIAAAPPRPLDKDARIKELTPGFLRDDPKPMPVQSTPISAGESEIIRGLVDAISASTNSPIRDTLRALIDEFSTGKCAAPVVEECRRIAVETLALALLASRGQVIAK